MDQHLDGPEEPQDNAACHPKLPMMWQPNGAYQLNEIANNLRGATPLNPSLNINPENWYFVK